MERCRMCYKGGERAALLLKIAAEKEYTVLHE